MSWGDGDYEDYLHELGWLEHKPRPPYPRAGHAGETVYSEEWAELMQELDRDGINAPNSMLAGILNNLPARICQRHATICASVITWLGTACGQSIILNGKRFREQGIRWHYVMAWHAENIRRGGVNGGYRIIEHLLAPPDHFGRDFFGIGGITLQRLPELSVNDYETVEHLMAWLGRYGEGFILKCELRIQDINRFERTKRDAEYRGELQRLGLAAKGQE